MKNVLRVAIASLVTLAAFGHSGWLGVTLPRTSLDLAPDMEATQARAEEQRTRVAQARNRLDQARVRAPADGVVTRRYLQPGELAGPGRPVVRLIGDGSLIVRFAAPPDQARSIRAAMRVEVVADDGSAPAVIEWISSEIDPPSGMVIVVAALDPATRIKPGTVVRVHPA